MKYIVVIADGMADYPISELGDKTPLEYTEKPLIDSLARESLVGIVKTVPENMQPGSDVANLSIFGYDPKRFFFGRAPLEAASMGVEMGLNDIAFRCNLVTLRENSGKLVMDDYSAGHITTDEAAPYIEFLNQNNNNKDISFYKGVSYRHLMLWRNGKWNMKLTPPHDIPEQEIAKFLPDGDGSQFITQLMLDSQKLLKECVLNKKRTQEGKKEVSSIWLWGHGKKPSMPTFQEKYSLKGTVIAAVDLIFGIGVLAGLKPAKVNGATGYIDTNFEGKVTAALNSLENNDICFVHIEACDEVSHEGSLEKKILGIKLINDRFLNPLIKGLEKYDNYRLLLAIDHPTPVKQKIHVADPVPFLIYQKNKKQKGIENFCEKHVKNSGLYIEDGYKLLDLLLNGGKTYG